jgi:hypothetical protein
MSVITKGRTFVNGEQLTAQKLNDLVDDASFNSSTAVDNSTTRVNGSGAITVKPQGITSTELAPSAVGFSKLTDVIDDDTMATATDTTLATSESIKAYVDGNFQARAGCVYDGVSDNILYSNGISGVVKNSTGNYTVTLSNAAPSAYFPVHANNVPTSGTAKNYSTGAKSTSTTTIDVQIEDSNGTAFDLTQTSIVAFW